MRKSAAIMSDTPSRLIDGRIKELGDWRGKTLARVRALIKQADPEVAEEWKWTIPAWTATSGARSTCTKATSWTKRRSRLWFGLRSRRTRIQRTAR